MEKHSGKGLKGSVVGWGGGEGLKASLEGQGSLPKEKEPHLNRVPQTRRGLPC